MQKPLPIVICGIPFDDKSSYLKGASQAPELIREALSCNSSNFFSEDGFDLSNTALCTIADDLKIQQNHVPEIFDYIRTFIDNDQKVLTLGGDHLLPILF